jgi:hypothetical protein
MISADLSIMCQGLWGLEDDSLSLINSIECTRFITHCQILLFLVFAVRKDAMLVAVSGKNAKSAFNSPRERRNSASTQLSYHLSLNRALLMQLRLKAARPPSRLPQPKPSLSLGEICLHDPSTHF